MSKLARLKFPMNKKFILFIDSIGAEPKVTLFDIENVQKISSITVSDSHQLSEQLLLEVERLLVNHNVKKSDLVAIIGAIGPGSYTGARIGITTANLLAFSLNIPVFSTNNETFSKKDWIDLKNKLKISDHFTLPILPIYKAPPFITKKT